MVNFTPGDILQRGSWPGQIHHRAMLNAGGLSEVFTGQPGSACRLLASASQGEEIRAAAVCCSREEWQGGRLIWVRGTNSSYYQKGRALLTPDDPAQWFLGERLLRWALEESGYSLRCRKPSVTTRDPLITVSRHKNGYIFSGYMLDTTATWQCRFPQGAPLLLGYETEIEDGYSQYRMPRGWQRECRIFVRQASGVVSCTEQCSVEVGIKRRMWVRGLQDADVRFYLEPGSDPVVQRVWRGDEAHEYHPFTMGSDRTGEYVLVTAVTGDLVFSW